MKVKLKQIKNVPKVEDSLSQEKEYFVLEISNSYFRVINDYGEPVLYGRKYFDIIDDFVPDDWVKETSGGGAYNIAPKLFRKPGFYEDLFDGKSDVVGQYRKYVIENGYYEGEDWERQWVNGRLIDNFGIK